MKARRFKPASRAQKMRRRAAKRADRPSTRPPGYPQFLCVTLWTTWQKLTAAIGVAARACQLSSDGLPRQRYHRCCNFISFMNDCKIAYYIDGNPLDLSTRLIPSMTTSWIVMSLCAQNSLSLRSCAALTRKTFCRILSGLGVSAAGRSAPMVVFPGCAKVASGAGLVAIFYPIKFLITSTRRPRPLPLPRRCRPRIR